MNQSSTTPEVAVSTNSKPYFPEWGLAMFVLFGLAAIGVVFCIYRRAGNRRNSDSGRRDGLGFQETPAV